MATFTLPADPASGQVAPASWGDDVRAALSFLANPPACRVTNSGTQSIAASTWTVLTFNTEAFDTDGLHSTVTNTGRLTIVTAGIYVVTAAVSFATNATGDRYVGIRKNGTGTVGPTEGGEGGPASASNPSYRNFAALVRCAAGDWLEVVAFQTSAGALNSIVGDGMPMFAATWMGLG